MYFKGCNADNFGRGVRSKASIKYIVVHYTGNNGDTARGNLDYFAGNSVKASAHYFVDEKEICCSVPWYNTAWHCGANTYKHAECRNANSIGIEMCSRKKANGEYYFHPQTIERAAQFVAEQMKQYGISISHVVRHYDVTGKNCPAPFVGGGSWQAFKEKVMYYYNKPEDGVNTMKYYEKLDEIPAGELRETIASLVESGIIKGNGSGLHLSEDMVRMLVYLRRAKVI